MARTGPRFTVPQCRLVGVVGPPDGGPVVVDVAAAKGRDCGITVLVSASSMATCRSRLYQHRCNRIPDRGVGRMVAARGLTKGDRLRWSVDHRCLVDAAPVVADCRCSVHARTSQHVS